MARGLNPAAPPLAGPAHLVARPLLRWRRAVIAVVSTAVVVTLFFRYLSLSRAMPVSADGASNALQARDILDGNLLLSGWTVTDVSFYTNELLVLTVVELLYGHHPGVVPVSAAVTYTMLVAVTALLAKGRATGREAVARMTVALAIIAVPVPGLGTSILLGSPDHTGTGVPLLVAWLLLDRTAAWRPSAVGVVLAIGQIADPLVMYVGAVPLVLVSGLRLVRGRDPAGRGFDARLVAAGLVSVLLAQAALLAIRLGGGFGVHAPIARFSPLSDLPDHLGTAAQGLAALFGAFLPDRHGPAAVAMACVHAIGLLAALAAMCVVAVRTLRSGRPVDRVTEVIAAGMLVNLAAYVVSTLPGDLGTARQLAAVLPLGAALAGRVWGPRLAAARMRAAVLPLLLAVELAVLSTVARPAPADGWEAAAWLDARGHRHGLGSYWLSNNITLATGGRVLVAPVTGGDTIKGYRWESRSDWYDAGTHDARFVVIDRQNPGYGTVAEAVAQFGAPIARADLARATILLYDHNLLVGLPAYCAPATAPSMAACPPI